MFKHNTDLWTVYFKKPNADDWEQTHNMIQITANSWKEAVKIAKAIFEDEYAEEWTQEAFDKVDRLIHDSKWRVAGIIYENDLAVDLTEWIYE